MNFLFDKLGGRKNFNFLFCVVLGAVLVFNDKMPGEVFFASIIAGLGVYSHYNVKAKDVEAAKIDTYTPKDSDIVNLQEQ